VVGAVKQKNLSTSQNVYAQPFRHFIHFGKELEVGSRPHIRLQAIALQ
jgi:hypothetical protein